MQTEPIDVVSVRGEITIERRERRITQPSGTVFHLELELRQMPVLQYPVV